MSVTVAVNFYIKPEAVDGFKTSLKDILPDTRAYDGCQKLTVHQSQDDPGNIVIWELWETRAKYEKYLAWRTETGLLDALAPIVSQPPGFQFLDDVDV